MEYKIYYKIAHNMEYQYVQTVSRQLLDAFILECFSDESIQLLIIGHDIEKDTDMFYFQGDFKQYLSTKQNSNVTEKQKEKTSKLDRRY